MNRVSNEFSNSRIPFLLSCFGNKKDYLWILTKLCLHGDAQGDKMRVLNVVDRKWVQV